MAIKTISRLDAFEVQMDEGKFDGRLHVFSDALTDTDKSGVPASDQPDFPGMKERPQGMHTEEDNYYNCLVELSKPVDAGAAGINSQFFESQKITYKDLAKNIILDTKAYLNVHNMLGEFNLCAMVFSDYTYRGAKTLYGSLTILKGADDGLNVQGNANISASANISGNANIKGNANVQSNASITGDTSITGSVTVGHSGMRSDISCWGNLELVNSDTRYGKIHSNNLTAEYHSFIVKNIISATDESMTIEPPVTMKDKLTIQKNGADITGDVTMQDDLTVAGNTTLNNGLTATGNVSFNDGSNTFTVQGGTTLNTLTVNNGAYFKKMLKAEQLSCASLTCTADTAYLIAERARWADLAECYVGDAAYESGTLVMFGGAAEVTVADGGVNAVVAQKPAYLMNSDLLSCAECCQVTYVGRVPVKVAGKIRKFDDIVLKGAGVARRRGLLDRIFAKRVVGKALVGSDDPGVKLVECFVRISV